MKMKLKDEIELLKWWCIKRETVLNHKCTTRYIVFIALVGGRTCEAIHDKKTKITFIEKFNYELP